MMKVMILAACAILLGAAEDTPPKPNLLLNGDFAQAGKDDRPAQWTVYGAKGQTIAVDKDEHPKDCPISLKVTINEAADGQGAISQKHKKITPNKTLVLTGYLKGTAKRLGCLQVKLKNASEELKRITTDYNGGGADWQAVKVEFTTGEADEMIVQCRYSQSDNAKGQTVWFADLKLTEKE